MIIISLSARMKRFKIFTVLLLMYSFSMCNKNVNQVTDNVFNYNILSRYQICGNII